MNTTKNNEQDKPKERNSTEHIIKFDMPKSTRIEDNDPRLNHLVAQCHLYGIIGVQKNGGRPAKNG